MEHPENITEIVNDIAVIADDLSEDETEQQTMGYLHQLQRMTKDPITLGKQTAVGDSVKRLIHLISCG